MDIVNNLKIKADENYKVAEYSERKNYYDVAVSRYYYYIYQNIILYLSNNSKDFLISETESHKNTLDFFICVKTKEKKIDLNLLKVLYSINKLRNARNKSDYENTKIKNDIDFCRIFKYDFDKIDNALKQLNVIT